MSSLIKFVKDFAQDEEGLTVVEYVVGAALLIIAFTAAAPWNALVNGLTNTLQNAESANTPAG